MPKYAAAVSLCLGVLILSAQNRGPSLTPDEKALVTQLRTLRSIPDDQRGDVTKHLAAAIHALPADDGKVYLATGLAGLSTEGDFGRDTLQSVTTTLADALRERPSQSPQPYDELAQLIRYEHLKASLSAPALTTALANLESADRDREKAGFTLTDLHGKTWTLKALRNHIVVVNFWATWCSPCRKEMPNLDSLYRKYQKHGLVILALSDEKPEVVESYLSGHAVTYPILIDEGHKVAEAFHVDGIPKSFVYDRAGKLAAQSIDMRTKRQFLEMLKAAGLAVEPQAAQ